VKLGDWLRSKGKITEEQLARALQDQSFFGGRLGSSLIKLGYVDEDTLGEYLADISHTRYAPAQRLENISQEVIATVPAKLAAKYRIVPIAIKARKLHLVMRDPKDLIALDEISFLTGLSIEPYVASEGRIVRAIERYYGIALAIKTIPVADMPEETARLKAPPRPEPPASPAKARQPELGLDGLPLNADPSEVDEPFVSSRPASPPPPRGTDEALPASLDEWRMARQEIPDEFPEPVAARAPQGPRPPADTSPVPAIPAREGTAASPKRPAAAAAVAVAPTPPPPGTIEAISERLRGAETRDEIFDAILDFTSARFHRAALFVIQQDRLLGWSGRGEGLSPGRIRNVTMSFDRPSLFVFFRSGGDYFYGPVPDLPANAKFYLDLGCPPPARVLLLPLTIKDRPAVILYADNGSDAAGAPDVQLYRRLLHKAALALEVLILKNKIMMV
jgi:Type II secretion system (T2SS), protein E, N-terminal domain